MPELNPKLARLCGPLAKLPKGATWGQIAKDDGYVRDRYGVCAARHAATVTAYDGLASSLNGAAK